MGSWFAVRSGIGYTYAAVADTVEQDTREKFKCMVINWYMYCFNNYYQILIKNYCNSSRLKYTLSSYTCTCSWRIIKPTNLHCLIYLIDDIEEPERCQQSDPMGHVSFPRLHKFEWRLQGSTQISFNQK